MKFNIRPYNLNDIDAIVSLHFDFKKNHEERFEAFYYKTNKNVNDTFKTFLINKVNDLDFACLVAINNENVITGYASGFIQYRAPIYELQRFGWWSNLFVNPTYRKNGIAEALYYALENWFKIKEVVYIELSRNAANQKMEQYLQKLGFVNLITHMVKPLTN